jgi:hypothetical protein
MPRTQLERTSKLAATICGHVGTPVNAGDTLGEDVGAPPSDTRQEDGPQPGAGLGTLIREDFLLLFPVALFFVLGVFALSMAFS